MTGFQSNSAFNPIDSMSSFGHNLYRGIKKEVPYTYAFRTRDARAEFDALANKQGFKWYQGSLSKSRVATGAIGGYMLADGTYRAFSGGSMYQNSSGQRDIVGIPFF